MALSIFTIRLIFLTIPGIISTLVYRTLKGRPTQKDWEDVLEIAIFSLLSYSICGLFADITRDLGLSKWEITSFNALMDDKIQIPWYEIYIAIIVGIILAFIAALLHKQNTINSIGRWFHVTSMFGNKDVWDFFQKEYGAEWVFVRDHKSGLSYFGHIHVYSDSEKERELIIEEVTVFSTLDGEYMYCSPIIYVSRNRDDLSIELPAPHEAVQNEEQSDKETVHE